MVLRTATEARERLFELSGIFQERILGDPELLAFLPERFVLVLMPLDEPEAMREALEDLSRARGWEGEGPLVYALFQGGELLGLVLPEGRLLPARAA